MSRRGKVSAYDQRDRENKRWLKKVKKTITPSKRTQRAIAKAIVSSISSGSTVQPTYKERTPYKQTSVKWKDARPTLLQWAGCFAIGLICLFPILSIWKPSFDISEISLLFIAFFAFPFLVATLCVVDYNKTEYRSYHLKDTAAAPDACDSPDLESAARSAPEEKIAEIDRINAKILMDECYR